MQVGDSIGWGVFYQDDCTNDKAEQLCLVFVMFNKLIVDALFVLQPEGGFVPIVLLQPFGELLICISRAGWRHHRFAVGSSSHQGIHRKNGYVDR